MTETIEVGSVNKLNKMHKEILLRLIRMETKLVRGFSEMGIDLDCDNWMEVDNHNRAVYLKSMGRSMMVIASNMKKLGATQLGQEYDLIFQGKVVGSILYEGVVTK